MNQATDGITEDNRRDSSHYADGGQPDDARRVAVISSFSLAPRTSRRCWSVRCAQRLLPCRHATVDRCVRLAVAARRSLTQRQSSRRASGSQFPRSSDRSDTGRHFEPRAESRVLRYERSPSSHTHGRGGTRPTPHHCLRIGYIAHIRAPRSAWRRRRMLRACQAQSRRPDAGSKPARGKTD